MLESALRESNPPRQVGSLEPLPLGQEHVLIHQAEAVGLEPTTDDLPAPAFEAGSSSSRMTSRKAAVAGIEPASKRLTAACPYQHEHHRTKRNVWIDRRVSSTCDRNPIRLERSFQFFSVELKRGRSTDPARKTHSEQSRLSDATRCKRPVCQERPAGVEPALPPWQGSRLPLHHGR